LNRRSFTQQAIAEVSEILTVQKTKRAWFQFFRSSDTIGAVGGFAYYLSFVRGAGSPCIQSSSQPMLDLALIAVYHRDLARALEGVELLGPQGIRVNAVAPGVIDTDMSNFTKTEAGRAATLGMQALNRIGKPEDVADVVAFLASDKAHWITGASIPVDGGSKL
jgi:hypothetical protein